ncbi:hypothetical protein Ciccas_010404 [Cichlidogyrus casuarinus]|uniref:Uncharacterized protein n=1 Tax=Cichlidogyrus casuarinus TaxID=1844966 RepID=A0ABD2PVB8_9PLAT
MDNKSQLGASAGSLLQALANGSQKRSAWTVRSCNCRCSCSDAAPLRVGQDSSSMNYQQLLALQAAPSANYYPYSHLQTVKMPARGIVCCPPLQYSYQPAHQVSCSAESINKLSALP